MSDHDDGAAQTLAPQWAKLAHQLADLERGLDCHLWQVNSNSVVFEEIENRRDHLRENVIPDDVLFTPEFFAAYEARRVERNARAERGAPFAVIAGGAS
jgi:hypothetical protein